MKHIFFFLLFASICHGQNFGVSDFSSAKSPGTNFKTNYENWMIIGDHYMMIFEKTPVGLRHAQQKVKELLSENQLSFEKPDRNTNYFGSYVKGLFDYENLNLAVSVGDAEIGMAWFIGSNSLMFFNQKDSYTISINN